MLKVKVISLTVVFSFILMSTALAVMPGKTLVFEDGEEGKVTFDGTKHKKAGVKCMKCHNGKIFLKMKEAKKVKGPPKLKMEDMNNGKNCGACHDGKKEFKRKDGTVSIPFDVKDKNNCVKCHKKE